MNCTFQMKQYYDNERIIWITRDDLTQAFKMMRFSFGKKKSFKIFKRTHQQIEERKIRIQKQKFNNIKQKLERKRQNLRILNRKLELIKPCLELVTTEIITIRCSDFQKVIKAMINYNLKVIIIDFINIISATIIQTMKTSNSMKKVSNSFKAVFKQEQQFEFTLFASLN
ncbi:unnamed protein product [Paramecium primaurelia]|uniref:Uncharacterized protein n=1 Tax=Paramecium primaurelia TaxID=5886 RepID=A0A8S1JQD7_PARPR|nr:unnamed protein product [Paramecium primaurelia]